MVDRLKGKVAVVIGGATGMGRGTVLRFVEEGAKVVIADRNRIGSEETLNLARRITPDVEIVDVDVSKWQQVQDMIERTVARFGRLDVAVNLAAILMLTPPLVEIEERQWDMIMDTNLKGVFFCCKAAIPEMIRSGGGSIINISSSAGIDAWTRSLPYNVSKAGVIHLTRVAAGQYTSRGVRINCIIPGPFDTPQARGSTQSTEAIEAIGPQHPMGRLGQPEDMASAILFLASDEASYISGSILTVDGGSRVAARRM